VALRNTTDAYGSLAKLLHWTTVLLLVGLVPAGLIIADMERGPAKQQLEGIHISVGLVLLVLMTIRVAWKFGNPSPADPANTPGWQNTAAHLTHWALYAAIYFQIIIGILGEGQRPIAFFGLFEFGPLIARNESQHELFEEVHASGWIVIAVLAGLHLLAVLHHHFIRKNDVLRRMTTG
jgi:cytochrome b561